MATRKILIADDDVDALRLVGLMLERKGYQIIAASNGQQAVQKAIETQPDLVILDVMMPDLDGYEVSTSLRDHPVTENVPILMFSAKTTVSDKIAGYQAGADDYVTKPVHPDELVARIEALLERSEHEREETELGNIAAFLPTKGGIGSSTLALNTAVELKQMHNDMKVILVELREGGGTAGIHLGVYDRVEPVRGLASLLQNPLSSLTKQSLRQQTVKTKWGIDLLLAAPGPAGVGPRLSKEYGRTMLRFLSNTYDYVILDLPSRLDEVYTEVLKSSTTIVLTLEPNPVGIEIAQLWLEALESANVGDHKIGLVLLHRTPAPGILSRNRIEQTLGHEMVAGIPPAPDLAYTSVENTKPMVRIEPQGLIAQQVRRVVQAIVED